MQAEARESLARTALDESQARLAAVMDSAMDAIITVDAAQNVVLFNRAAERMFGVRRDQAIGSALEQFLPQRFRGTHRDRIERFGRTGAVLLVVEIALSVALLNGAVTMARAFGRLPSATVSRRTVTRLDLPEPVEPTTALWRLTRPATLMSADMPEAAAICPIDIVPFFPLDQP